MRLLNFCTSWCPKLRFQDADKKQKTKQQKKHWSWKHLKTTGCFSTAVQLHWIQEGRVRSACFWLSASVSLGPKFTHGTQNPIFPPSRSRPFVRMRCLFFSDLGASWEVTEPVLPAKCYYFQGAPLAKQSAAATTAVSVFFSFLVAVVFERQILSFCQRKTC